MERFGTGVSYAFLACEKCWLAPKDHPGQHQDLGIPLHKHRLSCKDIEACLTCDLDEFDDSPFRDEVQAFMPVPRTKAEE
ncbi:hypothetical protein [Ectothiorhodospira shaposhnikovii]|uniref:hypothetical protein n=1 Tax=Ectothiorhodospira shaposhnikovii TaxID=1054 RepID=UPI001906FD89|nr:hypothetical protein [Ectothiorhodospira shaposhnikovii]